MTSFLIAFRIIAVRLLSRTAAPRRVEGLDLGGRGRNFTWVASPGARLSIGPTRMRPFLVWRSFQTQDAKSIESVSLPTRSRYIGWNLVTDSFVRQALAGAVVADGVVCVGLLRHNRLP